MYIRDDLPNIIANHMDVHSHNTIIEANIAAERCSYIYIYRVIEKGETHLKKSY